MRIKLLSIGKIKDRAIHAAVEEYFQRLRRHFPIDWVELRKESTDRPVGDIRRLEGERLLEAVGDALLVMLDEKGKLLDSRQFAGKLQTLLESGRREIVFAIGGAYGHGEEVKRRADWVWSLSPLTFTHQHVPLIVAEQLYRASTILRGEPYHND